MTTWTYLTNQPAFGTWGSPVSNDNSDGKKKDKNKDNLNN